MNALSFYEPLIPSPHSYFTKFEQLDEIDVELIYEMARNCPEGPRNVRKLAQRLNMPQQTANYRVLRFDHRDLVRFRAVANWHLFGLTSYAIVATVKTGLLYENKRGTAVNAGTFLTCYPVWRRLEEIHGGQIHGFFATYLIPAEKETELQSFFRILEQEGCILEIDDFCEVTQTCFNMPSLSLLRSIVRSLKQGNTITFSWEKWADDFHKAEEARLSKVAEAKKAFEFSQEDLLVISHLEQNLREKSVSIAKNVKMSSAKVTELLKGILKARVIDKCKVELYPIDPASLIHLTLKISFSDSEPLGKFISHLNNIPYPASFERIIEENDIFLHVAIPPSEYFEFHNIFEKLNRRKEIFQKVDLYMGNYKSRFDNVKLFEAYSRKENDWAFSLEVMQRAFRNLVDATNFQF